jgi:hypothetical protein
MNDQHSDPLVEAALVTAYDAVKAAAILAAFARKLREHHVRVARGRHEQDERTRRLREAQEIADRAAARARWAPANDPSWLRNAGLADTATAWCAAVPFADPASPRFDPSAVDAARNCETRFRDLHPHAMDRYDRLRGDGLGAVEAMREAAPLFARPPVVHDIAQQLALGAGNGRGDRWALAMHGPSREDFEAALRERRDERARQIAERMRGQAANVGEARAKLEATTNLPLDVIAAVTPAGPGGPGGKQRARQPWRDDFPFPIREVLAARSSTGSAPQLPRHETAKQASSRGPGQGR